MLYHMVYASMETVPFSGAALADLVERSRVRNERHGITAMLLHQQGAFLHAIEGEEAKVRALYAKVSADPRHRISEVLVQIQLAKRVFAGQAMGFCNAKSGELELGSPDLATSELPFDSHDISWRGCLALRCLRRFWS